eukprot:TRINITY_DN2853_c0_g1_i1.p1 TRINITY_DN2853_c0_g1~~TRINITY_DN2853_c0_g1_i1.p1  ORF type:complete len:388 (-),score=120.35 TRINITY_DN2853_c0_g1_i1:50-1189(-)
MGAAESREETFVPTEGFHVIKMQDNSPGSKAGLVPFFDYIVAANNTPLETEDRSLVDILQENIDKEVLLHIWNSQTDTIRETVLVPSQNWGGTGLIGVSIRFSSLEHANEFVWHILDVFQDSPAGRAHLEAHNDYVIGTPDQIFSSSEDFYNLVEASNQKNVEFYVYNARTETVRTVQIKPDREWGGEGSLGCDTGYGLLHKIPSRTNIAFKTQLPGDAAREKKAQLEAQQKASAQPPVLTTPQVLSQEQLQKQLQDLRAHQQRLQDQLTVGPSGISRSTTPTFAPTVAPASVAAAPVPAPAPAPAPTATTSTSTPVQIHAPIPAPAPAPVATPVVSAAAYQTMSPQAMAIALAKQQEQLMLLQQQLASFQNKGAQGQQ